MKKVNFLQKKLLLLSVRIARLSRQTVWYSCQVSFLLILQLVNLLLVG